MIVVAWGSARSAPSKGYLEESSLKDGGGAEPLWQERLVAPP